jgi:hypothetical protein
VSVTSLLAQKFVADQVVTFKVYLRMPKGMEWTAIPEKVLLDCCQLVKANSIEGNKKNNISIIYTPASNLKKTGDMAIGQVSFHKDKLVRRFHVAERQNEIVNRMNKTKSKSPLAANVGSESSHV